MKKCRLGKSRFLRIIFGFTLIISCLGCTTTASIYSEPPKEDVRDQIHTVVIAPSSTQPQIIYSPEIAKGRDRGALKGTAGGAAAGAAAGALEFSVGSAAASGGFGIIFLPFWAAVGAVIGGTAGGVSGAVGSVPADKADLLEERVNDALGRLNIQDTMAEHIKKAGEALTDHNYTVLKGTEPSYKKEELDYKAFIGEGVDTFLKVNVIRLGFKGGKGANPIISFNMIAKIEVIDTSSGKTTYSKVSEYVSKDRQLSEWTAYDAQQFINELEYCYTSLAESVIEELFLLYLSPSDRYWQWTLKIKQVCGPVPIYPEFRSGGLKKEAHYEEIYSLQPTFRWEAFPLKQDLLGDKSGMLARIEDVSYDLKIWDACDFNPLKPVYVKEGIKKPEHRIEVLLEPSRKYFWSFRSRFRTDDQYRVTKWSFAKIPVSAEHRGEPCRLVYIPAANYHRFVTPPQETRYEEVQSLQPTLRWEAFQSPKTPEWWTNRYLPEPVEPVEEISYELKIWRARDFNPGEPMYEKTGIEEPEHKVEISLEPSQMYFWSYRTWYKEGNLDRLTKWSYSTIPSDSYDPKPCNPDSTPIIQYHRFMTPP